MTITTTRQVLLRIDELLNTESKWCKGLAYGEHGELCLFLGALGRARLQLGLDIHALAKTPEYAALTKAIPEGYGGLPLYNEHPNTTFQDIKALLQRAIAATP